MVPICTGVRSCGHPPPPLPHPADDDRDSRGAGVSTGIAASSLAVTIALSPPAVVLSLLFGGVFIPGSLSGHWLSRVR